MLRIISVVLLALLSLPPAEAAGQKAGKNGWKAQPTTFDLQETEIEAAWSRALEWVMKNSAHPVQFSSSHRIETAQPEYQYSSSPKKDWRLQSGPRAVGYTITRTDLDGGTVRIEIEFKVPSMAVDGEKPARVLARYVSTADEGCAGAEAKDCFRKK